MIDKPISFNMTQAQDLFDRYMAPMGAEQRKHWAKLICNQMGTKTVNKHDRKTVEWFLQQQMRVNVIVRTEEVVNV